jgi:hypothetical protein
MKRTVILLCAGIGLVTGCATYDRASHGTSNHVVIEPAGAERPEWEWDLRNIQQEPYPIGVHPSTETEKNINRRDSDLYLIP